MFNCYQKLNNYKICISLPNKNWNKNRKYMNKL